VGNDEEHVPVRRARNSSSVQEGENAVQYNDVMQRVRRTTAYDGCAFLRPVESDNTNRNSMQLHGTADYNSDRVWNDQGHIPVRSRDVTITVSCDVDLHWSHSKTQ
jgi:hypothetical protein